MLHDGFFVPSTEQSPSRAWKNRQDYVTDVINKVSTNISLRFLAIPSGSDVSKGHRWQMQVWVRLPSASIGLGHCYVILICTVAPRKWHPNPRFTEEEEGSEREVPVPTEAGAVGTSRFGGTVSNTLCWPR